MALKAVIFDLGNTLITYPNPDEVSKRFHEKAVEIAMDRDLPRLDYSALLKKLSEKYLEMRQASFKSLNEATFAESLKLTLEELGLSMLDTEQGFLLEGLYRKFFSQRGGVAKLISGALEIQEFLKEKARLRVAIISNTPWPEVWHIEDLFDFGILNRSTNFPAYFSSQEGLRKPNPELFKKVLREMNLTPDEAIYVGDNFSRDVVGPNSIGMKAIWLSTKSVPEGQALNGWQVANLAEAKMLIESLITE